MVKNEKFFNTVGAINPEDHYFLPHRLNWQQLKDFIEKKYYFIVHAPRQSGKTTSIIEFAEELNTEGKYRALYISTEAAHIAHDDIASATESLLSEFKRKIQRLFADEVEVLAYLDRLLLAHPVKADGVIDFLTFWAEKSTLPLVLFLDEFDGLTGNSLISLLKQFRTGYTDRPKHFPQTICLIGVRDLRDYKVKTKEQETLGVLYSPFNIKAESLVLPDFSKAQVAILYGEHTRETGQIFTEEALDYAFDQTRGQPWLVNALAYQACFRDVKDRLVPITKDVLERSREALIKRCDTHMDALLDRLTDPRVRGIMDVLLCSGEGIGFPPDDLQYVRDLGILCRDEIRISNPIYQEIIPRALSYTKQEEILQEGSWYQKNDGSLDVPKLLAGFSKFYREHAEVWMEKFAYKEAGPHLLLLAFLQRILNGGGKIHREYALGRKRVDLFIQWKTQSFVIELKIKRREADEIRGIEQTAEYMDTSGAKEGHLVMFDRDPNKSWDEKIYHKKEQVIGKTIEIWGM
jgi:hypothetical protein